MNDAKLKECSAKTTEFVNDLLSQYDVRYVMATLGVRYAEVMGAALAAGVERRYVTEVLASVLEFGFAPPERPPIVQYFDGDEALGRKQ